MIDHYMVNAEQPIPAGKHQVRMEFAYDGGGLAKGGDVTLYYDGERVGDDSHDHLIKAEDRLTVAMARQ